MGGDIGELRVAHGLDFLAQLVQLGLARHLVEAGAELRRHRPHPGHELPKLAQQDRQILWPNKDQGRDGDHEEFEGASFRKHAGGLARFQSTWEAAIS